MALLRNGGRYLVIGQADPTPALLKGTDFTTRQLSVFGVRSGDISHYYRAVEFLRAFGDRFPFGDLLGQRYGLSGVDAALSAMGEARELKPVIVPILG
jgi:Zn-dependent alcohol dehydrogenase